MTQPPIPPSTDNSMKLLPDTQDALTVKSQLERHTMQLIDVREPVEYGAEHIPGALNYPLSRLSPSQLSQFSSQDIVLYCQSGHRSFQALTQIKQAGMNRVSQLEGGIQAWKSAGFLTQVNPKMPISLMRQVQIVAGSLVVLGVVLGSWVNPAFLGLSAFVGAGLVFAGVTNTCAMGMMLAKLPYNQPQSLRRSSSQ